MELTPELLLEAKFGPSRRGYDMEEVDDFLERVAQALDVLHGRLTDEFTRAEQAEAEVARLKAELAAAQEATVAAATEPEPEPEPEPAPAEAPAPAAVAPPAPSAEEAMRVLVHAERTAEAVVAEAKEEAGRLTSEAETSSNAMRTEADALLQRARSDAEAEARKAGEATRRAVLDEVNALRVDRDRLAGEVRAFKRWVDENRARVRTAVRDLQRIVDDPNALREQSLPGDEVPAPPAETPSAVDGDYVDITGETAAVGSDVTP